MRSAIYFGRWFKYISLHGGFNMFVKLEVFTECDQRIEISNNPDTGTGLAVEVFEANGNVPAPRLYLNTQEVKQLSKALLAADELVRS